MVVTQNLDIHRTRAQWALCQDNKVGFFFFKPPRAGWDYWLIVREVVNRWDASKDVAASTKRPFGRVIEVRKPAMQRR